MAVVIRFVLDASGGMALEKRTGWLCRLLMESRRQFELDGAELVVGRVKALGVVEVVGVIGKHAVGVRESEEVMWPCPGLVDT
jgi:hypothetical protein